MHLSLRPTLALLACTLATLSVQADERLLQVSLEQLHPTQAAVGREQIYYKLGRYEREPKKAFDDLCEANGQGEARRVPASARLSDAASFDCADAVGSHPGDMKTVVIGPGGRYYLTDGHHTFTALWEQPGAGPQLQVWVRVTDDFSDAADPTSFWARMQDARKVRLRDGQGRAIEATQLPAQLGLQALQDDPYRSLMYFLRDAAYAKPRSGGVVPEFLEFYWADWLRTQQPLDAKALEDAGDYADTLRAAGKRVVALAPDAPVGDSGYSARQLGGFDHLNSRALSKTLNGKLAYALAYRREQR